MTPKKTEMLQGPSPQGFQTPTPPSFRLQLWDLLVASSKSAALWDQRNTPDLWSWVSIVKLFISDQVNQVFNYQLEVSIILQLLHWLISVEIRRWNLRKKISRALALTSMRSQVLVILVISSPTICWGKNGQWKTENLLSHGSTPLPPLSWPCFQSPFFPIQAWETAQSQRVVPRGSIWCIWTSQIWSTPWSQPSASVLERALY